MIKLQSKITSYVPPGTFRSLGWEVILTGLMFPASVMLNRALGAENRGLLALTILIPTTMFGIASCQWDRLLKGLITSKQISGQEAWRRTLYYAFWLSLLFIPLGVISSLTFNKLPSDARFLSMLYCANFPLYFISGCLIAIYLASGMLDSSYHMKLAFQGTYLISLIALFIFDMVSVPAIVGVYFLVQIISLIVGWWQKEAIPGSQPLSNSAPVTPLMKGFAPHVLETLGSRIDIWVFSIFSSLVMLGQYTAIMAIMLPVGWISNALTSSSTAGIDWTKPPLVRSYLYKATGIFLCLLSIIILGNMVAGATLLELVLGKSFRGGEWMIPWIATIVVMQAAAHQFHSTLQLAGLQNKYLTLQSIEPVIRLMFVVTLGWILGEMGILLGMVITSCLKMMGALWLYRDIQ